MFETVPRKKQKGDKPTAFKWRVAAHMNICTLCAVLTQNMMGRVGGRSAMDVHVLQAPMGADGALEGNPFVVGTDICNQIGFLRQFFFLSSFLWVALLAEATYLDEGHHSDLQKLEKREWWLVGAIYSIGLVSVVAGQWFHVWGYMESGEWCWIRSQWPYMRVGIFYGPMLLVTCFLAVRTTQALTKAAQIEAAIDAAGSQQPELFGRPRSQHRKIWQHASLWFCAAFILVRLPSAVNRLANSWTAGWDQDLVGGSVERQLSLLTLAHNFCSPLQGVATSLAILLDRDIWAEMTMSSSLWKCGSSTISWLRRKLRSVGTVRSPGATTPLRTEFKPTR
eukprot:SAG31_NODE_2297_length_5987_cov_10.665251_3_plen_337_part_00